MYEQPQNSDITQFVWFRKVNLRNLKENEKKHTMIYTKHRNNGLLNTHVLPRCLKRTSILFGKYFCSKNSSCFLSRWLHSIRKRCTQYPYYKWEYSRAAAHAYTITLVITKSLKVNWNNVRPCHIKNNTTHVSAILQ